MAVIDGVCEFCGQTLLEKSECNCIDAKIEKQKNEAYERASNKASELMSVWDGEYMNLVQAGIKQIIFNEIKSVSIEDDYGIKLKLAKASKGYIKIEKTETDKSSVVI